MIKQVNELGVVGAIPPLVLWNWSAIEYKAIPFVLWNQNGSRLLWGAKKAPSEGSPESVCTVDMAMAMSRVPKLRAQGWQSRPPGTKCVDSECKKCPPQLPPPRYLQPEDCFLTETAPPEMSWTGFLDAAVFCKSCLLVSLSIITLPSFFGCVYNPTSLFNSV